MLAFLGTVLEARLQPPPESGVLQRDSMVVEAKLTEAKLSPAHAWTALGPDKYWYAFMDGWAHPRGPNAFEATSASFNNGQAGHFQGPLRTQYEAFSNDDELNRRWTVRRVLQFNLHLRETACNVSLDACPEQWTAYVPRGSGMFYVEIGRGPLHEELGDRLPTAKSHLTVADKPTLVATALEDYYAALGSTTIDRRQWESPRRAMGSALRPLATLFATFAELHPFKDANSRTRTFILQSEMARLGGHPLLLSDTGWKVYFLKDRAALETFLLQGWCAWERTIQEGRSPYAGLAIPHNATADKVTDKDEDKGAEGADQAAKRRAFSLEARLYDAESDRCTPPREDDYA